MDDVTDPCCLGYAVHVPSLPLRPCAGLHLASHLPPFTPLRSKLPEEFRADPSQRCSIGRLEEKLNVHGLLPVQRASRDPLPHHPS